MKKDHKKSFQNNYFNIICLYKNIILGKALYLSSVVSDK